MVLYRPDYFEIASSKIFLFPGDLLMNYFEKSMCYLSICILLVLPANHIASSQTFIMGYREDVKEPLIAAAPDNSGMYYDLFSSAVKKINCKLKIVRKSKKRILTDLKQGKIDFYPGFNFDKKRAEYVYYIKNGIPGGDIGLSLKSLPEITNLRQLKGKVLLRALGGPEYLGLKESGVQILDVNGLETGKAVKMLRHGHGDFYLYNYSSIEYYLKTYPCDDLKIHYHAYGGRKPFHLGFSKFSPKFKEEKNPAFDPSQPVSIANSPVVMTNDCAAYKLQQALQKMTENKEIQKLYDKYFK